MGGKKELKYLANSFAGLLRKVSKLHDAIRECDAEVSCYYDVLKSNSELKSKQNSSAASVIHNSFDISNCRKLTDVSGLEIQSVSFQSSGKLESECTISNLESNDSHVLQIKYFKTSSELEILPSIAEEVDNKELSRTKGSAVRGKSGPDSEILKSKLGKVADNHLNFSGNLVAEKGGGGDSEISLEKSQKDCDNKVIHSGDFVLECGSGVNDIDVTESSKSQEVADNSITTSRDLTLENGDGDQTVPLERGKVFQDCPVNDDKASVFESPNSSNKYLDVFRKVFGHLPQNVSFLNSNDIHEIDKCLSIEIANGTEKTIQIFESKPENQIIESINAETKKEKEESTHFSNLSTIANNKTKHEDESNSTLTFGSFDEQEIEAYGITNNDVIFRNVYSTNDLADEAEKIETEQYKLSLPKSHISDENSETFPTTVDDLKVITIQPSPDLYLLHIEVITQLMAAYNISDGDVSVAIRSVRETLLRQKLEQEHNRQLEYDDYHKSLQQRHCLGNHRIDFNDMATICGYLYRYSFGHTLLVEYVMKELIQERSLQELDEMLITRRVLHVVSVGGGPGNDLIGVCRALCGMHQNLDLLDLSIVDVMRGWAMVFSDVFRTALGMRTEGFRVMHEVDVNGSFVQTDIADYFVPCPDVISKADVVMMVKVLSVVPQQKKFQTVMKIALHMKPGALLVCIDCPNPTPYFKAAGCTDVIFASEKKEYNLPSLPPRFGSSSISMVTAYVVVFRRR